MQYSQQIPPLPVENARLSSCSLGPTRVGPSNSGQSSMRAQFLCVCLSSSVSFWIAAHVFQVVFRFCSSRLFLPFHAQAPPAQPKCHPPKHHVPDVRLPAGLRGLVLPQRRNLLHRQDRRLHTLQLRVSSVDGAVQELAQDPGQQPFSHLLLLLLQVRRRLHGTALRVQGPRRVLPT